MTRHIPEPDFPVLDSPRDNDWRTVLSEHEPLEPYIDETDDWCTMPLRVTHNPDNGVVLELGPYTLDRCDVEQLREAIRSFDIANNGPKIRVIG